VEARVLTLSFFASQELEQMLQDQALLEPQEHKPVMRYLVNLVRCGTAV
jgi:hypothetical protein